LILFSLFSKLLGRIFIGYRDGLIYVSFKRKKKPLIIFVQIPRKTIGLWPLNIGL